ncbi:protein arginine N-methyltransferase 7 isoform X2 [Cryptomeria japonica]|uniref:protein arginine N-methyltransferase 7 isoform X2 n=1 Tax=Cryptomeria japonica TaxID=3369 RepID=UPI0027D9E855|nr:protein arginine N-methyltransferase 7 isoform X2 [Cryptomeria japonica]
MGFALNLRHFLLRDLLLTKHKKTHFSSSFPQLCKREAKMAATEQQAFQLKLNPLTGESEWVVMEKNPREQEDESLRDIMAHTSYLDMLNDTDRNRAYDLAIRKTIRRPCHVLDIGAGSGLLSMMSLRAMREIVSSPENLPKEGLVTACDSYLPMVKVAQKVLQLNGMDDGIHLIHKRSDELQIGLDLPCRADVLVSEILDSELLGEGLIPTLQHAHDHLLTPNVETIPFKATIYGQLVQSTFLSKMQDLHGNEILASDGLFLSPVGSKLSKPFKVFDLDFWRRPDDHQNIETIVKITAEGKLQAIISWWVLQLDKEGTIFYSTAPKWIKSSYNNLGGLGNFFGGLPWCNHWKQCVWFIPGSGLSVSTDEEITVQAVHDAVSIQYCVKRNVPGSEECCRQMNSADLNLFVKPERIALLGDKDWRSAMLAVGRQCLQGRSSPLCVVVDDSLPLSIIAASVSSSSQVISLFPGIGKIGLQYLHNVAEKNGFSLDRVQVLGKMAKQLTMDDIEGKKVDVLLAEPFYLANEGMLPWQNLRFWNERTLLAPLLSETATIMPFKGILRGCAMYLPDLWKSRCSVKDVEGFDHSVINEIMGACGDRQDSHDGPVLPYAIWQCGHNEEISEDFTLMEFHFAGEIQRTMGKVTVPLPNYALCHGFVFWMDWVMDSKESIVISTRPGQGETYWKQGVKLLRQPIKVGNINRKLDGEGVSSFASSVQVGGVFDPSTGLVDIKLDFIT